MLKITLNLLVNAVTLRREFTIFNRVAIFVLLYSGIIGSLYLDTGIGIHNGLFHSTAITYSFDLFIYIIGTIIYFFTIFHARRTVQPVFPDNRFEPKLNGFFSKGYVKAYQNTVRCFQVVSTYPKQNLSQRRHYSTKYINADALKVRILTENRGTSNNNANPMSIVPILSYSNADTMKSEILENNINKTGIYR